MTFPTRSIRQVLLAVLALLIGLPVTAQSPGTSAAVADPAAAPGTWAQVVHLPDGGTQVVVGRSGLPGITALSEPVRIDVVGPQDGWLLAWWRDGDRTEVVRIDPTGRVRSLLRTPDTISAVALEPRGDRWVWATAHRDGHLAAIYRAKTTPPRPGARTRIAGGSRMPATRLLWLGSPDRLGVELQGDGGYRLRIHDLRSGEVRPSAFEGAERVIGALGDELLAGTTTETGAIAAPLIAIDPTTGSARSVTTGTGSGAYETETGFFIWDETNLDGSSTVRGLAAGAAIRTLVTVPSGGRTMASTSGDARADDADIAAFVPDGSWLGGGDPDATIITADLRSEETATVPAYEVLEPTGLAWMPLQMGGARDGASLWDAVEWSGGVAVLGARGLSRIAGMWRVSDETGWGADEGPALVPTTVPAGDTAPGLLGAARGRLLAVGVSDGADPHVVLWTSTDGRRWRRVPDQPAFHVPAGGGASLGLRTAATVEGRPALVVSACVETCERPWVLTQTGPGRWSRTAVPSGVLEVIDGYRRLLAEQEAADGTVRLIATTDGRRWGDTGTTLSHVGENRLVDTSSGPLVVTTDPVTEPLTIARTDDGTTWETTFTDTHSWDVQAIAAEGDRVVIVGDVILDWDRDVQVDATLISSDGGRTWRRSLSGRAPVGSRVDAVAIVGEHAIAVGSANAWVVALPE